MEAIKPRTQWDFDSNNFITRAGNGRAIPQYEPIYYPNSKKIKKLVPKFDANGKRVTKNLYVEIQNARPSTELGNLVRANPELLNYEPKWDEVDVSMSDVGSTALDDLLNAEIKLKKAQERLALIKQQQIANKSKTDAEKAKLYDELVKKQQVEVKQDEKNKK